MFLQIDSQTRGSGQQGVEVLIENEQGRVLTHIGGRHDELRRQRRFSGPRRPHHQRAGSTLDAPTEQGVQLSNAATKLFHVQRRAMLARDQARKDCETATLNDVVMIAASIVHAAILDNQQPPSLRSVFRVDLLQTHHPVRDALHLQVAIGTGQIVQQQHGAIAAGEELLQRQYLAAIDNGFAANRRSSDRESKTTRVGLTSSTSARIALVVSPNSTSDGWNMVYCSSGRRLFSDGTNSRMEIPSSVQPCEAPTS